MKRLVITGNGFDKYVLNFKTGYDDFIKWYRDNHKGKNFFYDYLLEKEYENWVDIEKELSDCINEFSRQFDLIVYIEDDFFPKKIDKSYFPNDPMLEKAYENIFIQKYFKKEGITNFIEINIDDLIEFLNEIILDCRKLIYEYLNFEVDDKYEDRFFNYFKRTFSGEPIVLFTFNYTYICESILKRIWVFNLHGNLKSINSIAFSPTFDYDKYDFVVSKYISKLMSISKTNQIRNSHSSSIQQSALLKNHAEQFDEINLIGHSMNLSDMGGKKSTLFEGYFVNQQNLKRVTIQNNYSLSDLQKEKENIINFYNLFRKTDSYGGMSVNYSSNEFEFISISEVYGNFKIIISNSNEVSFQKI